MLEVELKASLEGGALPRLRAAVEARGFLPQTALREIDTYFNGRDRDFRQTDEALRLRSCTVLSAEEPAKTILTYKGPKQSALSNTRTEYETAVGSGETTRALLEALGYQAVFVVDKVREPFALEGTTICLDKVAGLGEFLELERLLPDQGQREAAEGQLLRLLGELGVRRENLVRESYLELLMKKTKGRLSLGGSV